MTMFVLLAQRRRSLLVALTGKLNGGIMEQQAAAMTDNTHKAPPQAAGSVQVRSEVALNAAKHRHPQPGFLLRQQPGAERRSTSICPSGR